MFAFHKAKKKLKPRRRGILMLVKLKVSRNKQRPKYELKMKEEREYQKSVK